jgi:hypothetical protein
MEIEIETEDLKEWEDELKEEKENLVVFAAVAAVVVVDTEVEMKEMEEGEK